MHTSFLSRSVIAVASLAIGSVALAAAPATAAVPTGVTRDMVLSAAQGFYANEGAQHSPPEAVIENFERLISLTCNFVESEETDNVIHSRSFKPFVTGAADGILISVRLHDADAEVTHRTCTFAALATTDASYTLSGNATLTITGADEEQIPLRLSAAAQTTVGEALSGNVFVTAPSNVDDDFNIRSASLSTSGNATRSVNVTTTEKVTTPKSTAAKKAAKKKYDKKVKAAKKSYTKALKKAGKNKSKKAAAKKSYNKKKAAAKKEYNKAIVAVVSTVTKTGVQTENRPFAANVGFDVELDD